MNILREPKVKRLIIDFLVSMSVAFGGFCVAPTHAQSQCNDATATRPILFVHGFLGSSTDWGGGSDYGIGGIKGTVVASLSSIPGYSNVLTYVLYFNGSNVLLSLGNPATDPVVSNLPGNAGYIPCDARFFSLRFYGWQGATTAFDPYVVANVSIITKAYELSEVVKAITGITFSKDVIVAAHSMGALDTRAYVEGLGSTYDSACSAYPCQQAGTLTYAGDVAFLISVDGPNAGSDWSYLLALALGAGNFDWINVSELEPYSELVQTLNYHSAYNGVTAQTLPVGFGVDAIIDYYSDQALVPCTINPADGCQWDNIVTTDSQSITQSLSNYPQTGLQDTNNSYSISDSSIYDDPNCVLFYVLNFLHSLTCLGDWHSSAQASVGSLVANNVSPSVSGQLTQITIQVLNNGTPYSGANLVLNGPNGATSITSTIQSTILTGPAVPASPAIPTIPAATPLPYSLAYVSGGPSGGGTPTIIATDAEGDVCSPCYITSSSASSIKPNWNLTFTVNFSSSTKTPPTVTTTAATSYAGDGATLNGNVNPNGLATTAWFEWGTTSSYGNATPAQSLGSGSGNVAPLFALTGLASNTTYHYRIDANNSAGTSYGGDQSFTTLATLPAPTLISPSNGSSNSSTLPTFSWTAVSGASSYRIIIATTASALPSDPTSSTCGVGCVIDDTPIGPSYVPASGVLASGTTYYWEVHARSPLQFGTWSSVYSFTTSGSSLSSLTLIPSAVTSGSSSTVTATLDGPAPASGALISLTTTNSSAFPLASSLTISAGNTSGSLSVQAGTVANSTTVTVTATYNGSVASGVVTVSPSGGSVSLSSFTITPPTIVGGFSTQGNVFLTGPAPAGGAVVALSSNNTQFVQVPPSQSVTVAPGYTSAGFPITTSFTSGIAGATINASYNNTLYGASVTVLPVAATGVTFYPSSVDAGSPAPFTVYLNGPAPAGTSVSLTSSSPSVLQVSGSVPVPSGATSVSVTGTTFAVSSQTNVTVTATYNGGTAQGSLTVVPLSLIGFSLNPLEITGGSSVTGTVWLSDITPSGGVNVSLSSTSSLVQVPLTVNVAAGYSSATFTATTSGVSSVTNVTVTASYNGTSYNLTLTLVPPLPYLQSLSFAPATVDSGSSTVGTITLTSPAPLGGATVSLTSSFFVAIVQPAIAVQSGATTATFTVTTQAIGFISPVTITATYNGTTLSALVTIVPPGTPLAPSSLTLSPSVVTGGSSSTATVLLTGPAPAGGAALALSSDNAGVLVPPVITVPAGSNSATFTATTSSVSDVATATITATYGGLFESSLLTVEPTGTEPNGSPVPFLSGLVPASQIPNSAGLTVTVNGSGFVPGAQVSWNGEAVPTTYVSASQVQASIPSANTQTNGSGVVTVSNPGAVNPASNTLAEYLTYPTTAPSFNTVSLSSIELPYNVVVGDLNRDGKQDLIVGHSFQGLSVFLGKGDGTFGPELLLPGASPASAIGDFNGDGKPDIVTMSASSVNAVRLYLGNGDGTFTTTPDTPFATGYVGNTALAVGDFNGDGKLDVVVTGNGLTQAYVLLGNGDGTFGAPTAVGSVNQPFTVAVADFNGDGKLDLALTDFDNEAVAILLGNGDGTFQPQIEYSVNGYPYTLAVADFNNDQHPDIAVANGGPVGGGAGGVSVIINNGNGTFAAPVNYSAGSEFYFLTAGDVNGDSKPDLVVASTQPNQATLLFLGNGDGTFSTPLTLTSGTPSDFSTIADLNGDGAPDVVVSNNTSASGNISILLQAVVSILQVTPSTLSFTAIQGAGSPPSLSLAIANSGGGTETWSATNTQAWVVLGQTSGTAPSTLSISVNPVGLNPGTYTATITVTAAGASNSPQTVAVTLTINAGTVVVTSLTFNPNTLTGARTATGTVTLSGSAPSGGASISLSTNNSAVQVPATVTVPFGLSSGTFTATASSVTTQTVVTVTATYSGVSTTGTLTLNPTTQYATVSFTPSTLAFGNVLVGTSNTLTDTIKNTSVVALIITQIAVTGSNTQYYSESDNCPRSPGTLAAGATCVATLTFTPTVSGTLNSTLTITDNTSKGSSSLSLTGTGKYPTVSFTPSSLVFGSVLVGSSSVLSDTVKNTGVVPLTISKVALTGSDTTYYEESDNCPRSPNTLAAGATCVATVTFAPTVSGTLNSTLTITDNTSTGSSALSLMGTGKYPTLSFTPSSLAFGNVLVGSSSTLSNTVKNTGVVSLTITKIALTGSNTEYYTESDNCPRSPGTLAAGASCVATVTFKPTVSGTLDSTLTITDNTSTGSSNLGLTGTGKYPTVSFTPSSVAFGNVLVGSSSTLSDTVKNTGVVSLTITKIALTGSDTEYYTESDNCPRSPGTLAAGASCVATVTFKPTVSGTLDSTLTITDNTSTGSSNLGLTGTGKYPTVSFTPNTLAFGSVALNSSSTLTDTVKNTGVVSLTISKIALTGSNTTYYKESDNCPRSPSTLAAGATCVATVTFTPTVGGTLNSTLTITDNTSTGSSALSLTGTGK